MFMYTIYIIYNIQCISHFYIWHNHLWIIFLFLFIFYSLLFAITKIMKMNFILLTFIEIEI